MFISHRYRAVFVHIQRTGGNSVQKVFEDHDPSLVEAVAIDPDKRRTKHCFAADIAAVEPGCFADYTSFCVVRNPYERLLSWYHFLADGGHGQDAGIRASDEPPGLGLYRRGLERLRAGGNQRLAAGYASVAHRLLRAGAPGSVAEIEARCEAVGETVIREVRRHASSFSEFLALAPDHPGGLFERFSFNQLDYIEIDGAIAVDRVLRFEQLEQDFADLAGALDFPGALPHRNASSRGDRRYREAYDDRDRARVAERFARDLEAFGYEF